MTTVKRTQMKVRSEFVTHVAETQPVVHRSASRVYSGVDG